MGPIVTFVCAARLTFGESPIRSANRPKPSERRTIAMRVLSHEYTKAQSGKSTSLCKLFERGESVETNIRQNPLIISFYFLFCEPTYLTIFFFRASNIALRARKVSEIDVLMRARFIEIMTVEEPRRNEVSRSEQ